MNRYSSLVASIAFGLVTACSGGDEVSLGADPNPSQIQQINERTGWNNSEAAHQAITEVLSAIDENFAKCEDPTTGQDVYMIAEFLGTFPRYKFNNALVDTYDVWQFADIGPGLFNLKDTELSSADRLNGVQYVGEITKINGAKRVARISLPPGAPLGQGSPMEIYAPPPNEHLAVSDWKEISVNRGAKIQSNPDSFDIDDYVDLQLHFLGSEKWKNYSKPNCSTVALFEE